MRKTLLCLLLVAAAMVQARTWTPAQVKDVIRKVNTYWQQNNKAEVRSFWDNAAYHTGNMEVYKLLNDQQMLFGDWQICFQTYITGGSRQGGDGLRGRHSHRPPTLFLPCH